MMADQNEVDNQLIEQIRGGDSDAWQTLIDRYEGRLLAFTNSRIRDRTASEDIVQDAFVGFLISLPNYDGTKRLESYLFSICAYKLTDHLRREGADRRCKCITVASPKAILLSLRGTIGLPVPLHAV